MGHRGAQLYLKVRVSARARETIEGISGEISRGAEEFRINPGDFLSAREQGEAHRDNRAVVQYELARLLPQLVEDERSPEDRDGVTG
jgi:hypothetical protein